jgi:hypothetical protein
MDKNVKTLLLLLSPIYGNHSVQNLDWFVVFEEIDIY